MERLTKRDTDGQAMMDCGDPSYSRGMADNGVKMIRTTGCDIPIHEFGKTVFLTCEEVEKALEAKRDVCP